ncbi:MAG: phosphatidate cytidylyltransferase [Cytophagales bacterium]|nr:phosphatidate cytidylyltransferase [Bernardetiaceae bacterium]MDW8204124.1 phosphatidate cytidylyltransferase [Cytophagales bacterium]
MNWKLNGLTELQQRVIAAAVGALIILSALAYNEWTYFAVFFFISMFTMLEFYKLLGLDGNLPLRTFGTTVGLILFTLTFVVEKYNFNHELYYLVFVLLSTAFVIKLYSKHDQKPFRNVAFTYLGIIYVAVPFALLNTAVFMKGVYSNHVIMGSLFLIWASDTGAYFTGRAFGKHKLFFRISPKKTWEGSIGGTLLALAFAYLVSLYCTDLLLWQWLCIAIIIVITGTYGDLVESLFKRSIHIKDSGDSIPGHGGFLDRFDSLLLSAPFIVTFVRLVNLF